MSSSTAERLGIQLPSVALLPPASEASVSSLGVEAVEFAALAGLDLDPWQAWVLERSLAERAEDQWAAFMVGLIVARQNGKGAILEARELAGLFMVKESLILHSAHEFKTTYEHFLRITNLIEGCPDLERQVFKIRRGAGEQAIELRDGNRLRFIARTGGSGRGMSAPCVILDECMYLTDAMVGAIMPTLSAQDNPQLWLAGSAPLAHSAPVHRLRESAIKGDGDRTFYAEWGNEPDVDPNDPEAVARANPALGIRLWWDFIGTEREAMSPEEFGRERLGIPEPPAGADGSGPIDTQRWADLTDADSLPTDTSRRLCLDAPPGLMSATFSEAGRRDDGLMHVGIRRHVPPAEMSQVVEIAKALTDGHGCSLLIPNGSPARAFLGELLEAGVPVEEMSSAEYAQGCGLMLSKISEGTIRHRGQLDMGAAVAGLSVRTSGDVDVWSRRSSKVDIAPFVAATCALVRVPDSGPAESWLFD